MLILDNKRDKFKQQTTKTSTKLSSRVNGRGYSPALNLRFWLDCCSFMCTLLICFLLLVLLFFVVWVAAVFWVIFIFYMSTNNFWSSEPNKAAFFFYFYFSHKLIGLVRIKPSFFKTRLSIEPCTTGEILILHNSYVEVHFRRSNSCPIGSFISHCLYQNLIFLQKNWKTLRCSLNRNISSRCGDADALRR